MSPLDSPALSSFAFDNTYAHELEGLYVPWQAAEAPQPALVKLNHELAEELGLDAKALDAQLFSGNRLPPGAAMSERDSRLGWPRSRALETRTSGALTKHERELRPSGQGDGASSGSSRASSRSPWTSVLETRTTGTSSSPVLGPRAPDRRR